jgi:peptidoglycan hydrolase-like protein with peptidoglycan-binding domain
MRDMDLVVDDRPTGPARPGPFDEPEESRWAARARFCAAIVIGLLIVGGRTALTRPFATIVVIGFLAGAIAVGGSFFAQSQPHPAPLFAQRQSAPAQRDPIAELAARTVPLNGQQNARAAAAQTAAPAEPPPERDRAVLVRDLQGELTRLGHYQGTIDGRYGPRTDRAIRAAEQAVGLPVTGQPSERLLARLRDGTPASRAPETTATVPSPRRAAPPAAAPIEPGTVRTVQRRLADMGYAPGRLDGNMTPEFRRAIARFQQDNDLNPSGVIDRATVDRLAAITGPIS